MIAIDSTNDLINMDWRKIDTLVTDAWNIVSRRPASYYSQLNLVDYDPDQAAVLFTNHAAITQATAPCANKILKCQRFNDDGLICNDDFIWTAKEQILHKRLGYTSIPKSCPRHKQPTRQYANTKCRNVTDGAPSECDNVNADIEKCKLFQARKCGFGDQCKFVHSGDQLAIAHPSTMTDEDEEGHIVWHMLVEDEDRIHY